MRKYLGLLQVSQTVLKHSLKRSEVGTEISFWGINKKGNYSTTRELKDGILENAKLIEVLSKNYSGADDKSINEVVNAIKVPKALDECDEDLSDVAQYHRPSFNFAAYANKSETIQQLVNLGVELWKIEARPAAMEVILSRKFEDMKPHIQFLHDCGVPTERINDFITKNPMLFKETIDDLKTRIRYLRAHNFNRNDIAKIVSENPYWLSWRTLEIDNKLAYFQREFKLSGKEVRALVIRRPQLITYKLKCIRDNTFAIKEQMGFDEEETKEILLNKPKIWQRARHVLVASFDYVHNTMGISHRVIARQPSVLATPLERIKQRHLFLVSLKRAQYDPKKALYVPLDALAMANDFDFSVKAAKSSIQLYDMFLKTL